MKDDATLLRRYVDDRSEAAFTELVRRYIDLVYGAALRRTSGDAHRAADVAQEVFTSLARHARKLSTHPTLSAWLHSATRNAALNHMISDQRRRTRETEALALETASSASAAARWDEVRPLLDDAIDELPEADRTAVVLRFLEHRAFADIGAALRVSEDAARMRTERALNKLRGALSRRGITSTAAALGTLVSTQPLISAPAGLAAQLASHSLLAAGSTASVFTLLSLMNAKLVFTAAASALVAFVIGTQVSSRPAPDVPPPAPAEVARHEKSLASLRDENQRLAAEMAGLHASLASLKEANATLAAKASAPAPASAPRSITIGLQRWEIQQQTLNNLRQIDAARKQYQLEKRSVANSVHDLVGRQAYIKTVRPVDGEDYASLPMDPSKPMTVTTAGGVPVTFDPSGAETTRPEIPAEIARAQELQQRSQPHMGNALNAYRTANNGKMPPNEQALVPYFATPKDGADFVEYLEAKKAAGL
ncbi:MAG: sigma-70 family RNA polymerase sigma factor [Verrucomicrobiota bacterium]